VGETCNGVYDNCNGAVDDGATCSAGSTCVGGACVASCNSPPTCYTGGALVNGTCQYTPVSNGTSCGSSLVCVYGSCTAFSAWNCSDGYSCGAGKHCCGETWMVHGCQANGAYCP
jgi:hypothetical protein